MNSIINEIRELLKNKTDEKTKANSQRFFKEKINYYGVKIPYVNQIAKEYFNKLGKISKNDLFDLCDELWQSTYIEESFIAAHWSFFVRKQYKPEDFQKFEYWIRNYINNWASCDTFCNHSMGEFIEMYPAYIEKLKEFAKSSNRWVRRASAVSLIIPGKRGKFLSEIFEIADILLLDNDDLVQKGYGWMLKSASNAYQKEVFDYVISHKQEMPRTALRYAIEKMPKELKEIAMKK